MTATPKIDLRTPLATTEVAAREMHELLRQLFPIHRSMAGEGLRTSLDMLSQVVPLEITEVASGTEVLDWTVPQEWRIRTAFVQDLETGDKVIDYGNSNLHVVSHSHPIDTTMTWTELRRHLFTNQELPNAIPYQTAFFQRQWGFCLSHEQFQQLEEFPNRNYRVLIDSNFVDGSMTLGELVLRGSSPEEFLIHTHVCHPSLANDNLSGIVVACQLAKILQQQPHRYTYRFVFAPATIGAITWLAMHRALPPIRMGLVLTLLGDSAPLTYKRSCRTTSEIDRIASHIVAHRKPAGSVRDFKPWGYDERQYGSPGFHLPVGCLMRSVHHEFPEYHTSADSPDFVKPHALADSLHAILQIVSAAEHNCTYRHLYPAGEPMLSKRGFFDALDAVEDRQAVHQAALWILSLSNTAHDLLSIAERADMPFSYFETAAQILLKLKLIELA